MAINILLIGARKSILFILLAVMQLTGISIVVILYIAFINNLII